MTIVRIKNNGLKFRINKHLVFYARITQRIKASRAKVKIHSSSGCGGTTLVGRVIVSAGKAGLSIRTRTVPYALIPHLVIVGRASRDTGIQIST
jgi:hypothetical protein